MSLPSLPGQVFDFTVEDSSFMGLLHKIDSFTDVGPGGVLGILIMILVGGGLTMMLRQSGNERAFPVGLFVASLIGIFLRIMNFIGDKIFWACIALLIISIIFLIREQGKFE